MKLDAIQARSRLKVEDTLRGMVSGKSMERASVAYWSSTYRFRVQCLKYTGLNPREAALRLRETGRMPWL